MNRRSSSLISLVLAVSAAAHGCLETEGDVIVDPEDGGDPGEPIRVAAGRAHACAVYSSGHVYCWGDGARGQLGDGVFETSAVPVRVRGVNATSFIDAGDDHTCVIQGDQAPGQLYCWGANDAGQLGDGTTEDRATPVAVASMSRVMGFGLGSTHSCALASSESDDSLSPSCWGANDAGQLGGDGEAAASPVGVDLVADGISAFVGEIDAGGDSTCVRVALDSTGQAILCWGGAHGAGDVIEGIDGIDTGGTFMPLTVGSGHACVAEAGEEGTSAYCWGDDSRGQLGCGERCDGAANAAVQVVDVSTVGGWMYELSAGVDHTCSIGPSFDSIFCWGANDLGQLGQDPSEIAGSATPRAVPLAAIPRDGEQTVESISAGQRFTCATITARTTLSRTIVCWGDNGSGQLGIGQSGGFVWEAVAVPRP